MYSTNQLIDGLGPGGLGRDMPISHNPFHFQGSNRNLVSPNRSNTILDLLVNDAWKK